MICCVGNKNSGRWLVAERTKQNCRSDDQRRFSIESVLLHTTAATPDTFIERVGSDERQGVESNRLLQVRLL